jgi:hypothetical protein
MLELVRNRHLGIWLVAVLALAASVMPSVAWASHGADEDVPHGKIQWVELGEDTDHPVSCYGFSVGWAVGSIAYYGSTTQCTASIELIAASNYLQFETTPGTWITIEDQYDPCNSCSGLSKTYSETVYVAGDYRTKTVHEMAHDGDYDQMTTYR